MFDERKHPRDKIGRFTSSDGAGGIHNETPAESKRLKEFGIGQEKAEIELSKQEYAVLRKEVMRKNAEQKGEIKHINCAYTSNYYYIYSTTGYDEFIPLVKLDIEEDGDVINYYESLLRGKK